MQASAESVRSRMADLAAAAPAAAAGSNGATEGPAALKLKLSVLANGGAAAAVGSSPHSKLFWDTIPQ